MVKTKEETREERNRKDRERYERRDKVANLFNKGYNSADISRKLGVNEATVKGDLAVIRQALMPKTVAALEYRRNKSLAGLNLIKTKAWEVHEDAEKIVGKQKRTYVLLRALGHLTKIEEEIAKVQGLTTDKIAVPPTKKGEKLMKEIRDIKAKDKGDGHREEQVEVEDARSRA